MITLLRFLAFHLCYNFCTHGSVTVNLQAVDHCELRTTLKRLVENCRRKQFKRMIINELNSFSSKKFQGVHWRKKKYVKTHLLMLMHIHFIVLDYTCILEQLPNCGVVKIMRMRVLHLMYAYVHSSDFPPVARIV